MLDGDISVVYTSSSNVVNFLTVGDDFGDICLLDKVSHFTYICDTDVLCMFISYNNLIGLLSEQYRDQVFLTRRAKLRLNQLFCIKSRMVQAKRSIAENVILEYNKMGENANAQSNNQLSKKKSENLKSKPILRNKSSQVLPIHSSKLSIENKLEKLKEDQKNHRNQKKNSRQKENERSQDMLLEKSNSLNQESERNEDFILRHVAEPLPQPILESVLSEVKESIHEQVELHDNDPQDNPQSNLAALIKAKMAKYVVAGAAIRELQSTNAAISTGFSSKLIRASSFDREAQIVKKEKKEILTKLIRRAQVASTLVDTTEVLQPPFLEDFQADSKVSNGLLKLRDFVKRNVFELNSDFENKPRGKSKLQKKNQRVENSEQARKKNRLFFLARLHKAELDGSLIEDSEEDFNTRVSTHNVRI